MRNKQGKTIHDRITEEIAYANLMSDKASKKLLATKALGAVNIAVEFGLITMIEWEKYIHDIFKIV